MATNTELEKSIEQYLGDNLPSILEKYIVTHLPLVLEILDKHAPEKFSLLRDSRILEHMEAGNIIIRPFNRLNLGTASYDVALGEWFYRERKPELGMESYSIYSQDDVERVWGKEAQHAFVAGEYYRNNVPEGISPDDLIIPIPPGETFLCHTQEFIGGRNGVTTMMKARSSMGRNFIEICKCAGWGDVGFINRWTMEITNNSKYYTIPLPVGRRVAQIAFFEVGLTLGDYAKDGKYQSTHDVAEMEKNWKPGDMLPKMWKDREVREGAENVG